MPEEEQSHSTTIGKVEVSEHGQFSETGPTLYSVRVPWAEAIMVSYRPADEAESMVQEYIDWLHGVQKWIRVREGERETEEASS